MRCAHCGKELPVSSFYAATYKRCKRKINYVCKQCTYKRMANVIPVESLDDEEWRTIDEFPCFKVSNYGRVKRVLTQTGNPTDKLLSIQYKYNNGYSCVNLNRKKQYVHRLVARAFIENSDNKPQVNHKDGNKSNNHLSNLEWVTASENGQHAYHTLGIIPYTKNRYGKDANRHRAIKCIELKSGKEFFFDTITQASKELNISAGSITRCAKGEYKSTHGYVFVYR